MERLAEIVRKAIPFIALGIISYVGESGQDGGFIRDIWNAAKTASPFAAMFAILAWKDEQRERREAQSQCHERTIDFINSTNSATQAFGKLASSLSERPGHRGGSR